MDRLARLQAEFENARKRAEREKAEFRDYATGNVVEQFLPVLDNFELALKANGIGGAVALRRGADRQADGRCPAADAGDAGADGGRGIRSARTMRRWARWSATICPISTVAEEIRRGYKLRERLLRPAMVRVVSNPKQTERINVEQ